jgi:hypothetical protein
MESGDINEFSAKVGSGGRNDAAPVKGGNVTGER